MIRKQCLMILCILLVCLTLGGTALAAKDAPIQIYIDGEPLNTSRNAFLAEDGTVYVPLREICKAYGGTVTWDKENRMAEVQLDGTQIRIYPDSRVMEANGRMLYDEHPALIQERRLQVPAALLARAMNARLIWSRIGNALYLFTGGEPLESGESFYDADDLYWMSRIIDAEAGNQSLEGKIAVGNVVLNRVASESFADSIYGVIFQRGQFSPVGNGAIYRTPSEESVLAAKLALDGANTAGEALFFQNTSITGSNWMSRTRPVVMTLGSHTFYA